MPMENMHMVMEFAMLTNCQTYVTAIILIRIQCVFRLEALQCAIVSRPQTLYCGRLEQQCHQLGATSLISNGMDIAQEMLALLCCRVPGEMLRNAFADVAGLTYVNGFTDSIAEIVNPWYMGQGVKLLFG